jgi:hypothetical protein
MGAVTVFKIRDAYREYDRQQTLLEEDSEWLGKIHEILSYFRDTYSSDSNRQVYENVKTKADFILKLIRNRSLEEQVKLHKRTYDMLFETGARLAKSEIDVYLILSPLTNLYRELVEEHLEYIREHGGDELS